MTVIDYDRLVEFVDQDVEKLERGQLSSEKARALLERCAILKRVNALPLDVNYGVIERILDLVLGRASSQETARHLLLTFVTNEQPIEGVRLARGVDVFLTEGDRLAALSVQPWLFAEGRRAMSIVGIVSDTASDVAERHDDYLVDAYLNKKPHGER